MLDFVKIINLFTAVETAYLMGEPLIRFIGERDERYAMSFIFLNDKTSQYLWDCNDKVRCADYVSSLLKGHIASKSLDLDSVEMFDDESLRNTIKRFADDN